MLMNDTEGLFAIIFAFGREIKSLVFFLVSYFSIYERAGILNISLVFSERPYRSRRGAELHAAKGSHEDVKLWSV